MCGSQLYPSPCHRDMVSIQIWKAMTCLLIRGAVLSPVHVQCWLIEDGEHKFVLQADMDVICRRHFKSKAKKDS